MLRGGPLEGAGASFGRELDSFALELSGRDSSPVGGALVGNVGGGTGRLAEGASGISSGFCWAQPVSTTKNISAPSTTALAFFIISWEPALSFCSDGNLQTAPY
jgi:hypothetical protein